RVFDVEGGPQVLRADLADDRDELVRLGACILLGLAARAALGERPVVGADPEPDGLRVGVVRGVEAVRPALLWDDRAVPAAAAARLYVGEAEVGLAHLVPAEQALEAGDVDALDDVADPFG